MKTLLVNKPEGGQALLELQDSGSYFDPAAVLWDTSTDGPLPEGIQIGGMVRVDGALQVDTGLLVSSQAADLAARRAAVWERIKAHRRNLGETGGYAVMVGGVQKWFQSDPKSQVQQLGLARKADRVEAAGGNMDAQFEGASGLWKTFDNSFVAMTANVAHAVFNAAEAQDGALFARAEQHRIALYAAPDPDAYDWSTGWPTVYGGA